MKSGITLRSVAIFFVALVGLYLTVFYGCEAWRLRKGPWEVHFNSDAAGNPAVVIYQPSLGISSVEILFPGETAPTNLNEKVIFDAPRKPVPFGRVLYEDLAYRLPGVVTLDLFGHEIELLPRVLIVNRTEVPWQSEMVLELSPTNKPAIPPQPPKGHILEQRPGL